MERIPASERTSQKLQELLTEGGADGEARTEIDDRLGEGALVGKWDGWVLDDACELDGRAWSGCGRRSQFLGNPWVKQRG